MTSSLIYAGCYQSAAQDSISLLRLDHATAKITLLQGFQAGENPSFLTLTRSQKHLYAVNEIDHDGGQKIGTVSAFSVDPQTGHLSLLNRVSSHGALPVSLALSQDERTLLTSNYSAGNAVVLPLNTDHTLQDSTNIQDHDESEPAKTEQSKAHAHHVCFSPDYRFVFIVDLGLDRIFRYQLDPTHHKLNPTPEPVAFETRPKSGPRHMTFHPDGHYAYLIHEQGSFISVLAYDTPSGDFSHTQFISTIPEGFTDNNQCGAIQVSPDGQFLYASNRGHNSIVMYAVKQHGAHLEHLQTIDSGGDWPRDFALNPTGNLLLSANQRSNNLTSFQIDPHAANPLQPRHHLDLSSPAYLQCLTPR